MRRVKKRVVKAQRAKPLTPTLAIYVLIEDEEKMEENRKENEERNRELTSSTATMDRLISSSDPHGSYGKLILYIDT